MGKPTNGFDKRPEDINKDGAPEKEWTWAGVLKTEAEKIDDNEPDKEIKNKEAVAKAMTDKAKKGDVQAFKAIADRTDGLPSQGIDITSKGKELPGVIMYPQKHDDKSTTEDPLETTPETGDSITDGG